MEVTNVPSFEAGLSTCQQKQSCPNADKISAKLLQLEEHKLELLSNSPLLTQKGLMMIIFNELTP
jgi:hypothetical protein